MGKFKKILLADDDTSVRDILRILFEEEGYDVNEAKDGQEAWEKLRKDGADLGVFDLNMPRLNGIELMKKIRDDAQYSQLPIIMLTVKSLVSEQVRGYKNGADDYVTKPFERDVLLARVRALERRLSSLPPNRNANK